jgi:heparan-alpha-glucosaminide N-acetyltransferase
VVASGLRRSVNFRPRSIERGRLSGMSELEVGNEKRRLLSLDAYRGFVMLAMASGGLGIAAVSPDFPDSQVWHALNHQFEHVQWQGCSFWDLIQPSFMFIVGAAMPFSYAARRARGDSWLRLFVHALWRSFVLIALGVFLASTQTRRTNFVFVNVLAQIGLGYPFVFLTLGRRPRTQIAIAVAVLVVDWLLFAFYPLPPRSDEIPAGLLQRSEGFAQHWDKHTNVAANFDRWFLNLFPTPGGKPFIVNDGGYTTLNFVPSMATMIFGVLAGQWLRGARPAAVKVQALLIIGALCIAAGTLMDEPVCPIVKRIWTPTWTIYSAGWACWLLAAFYATIEVAGLRAWAFPLVVVGANSIAAYLMAQLMKPFVWSTLKTHLGREIFDVRYDGVNYQPIVQSVAFLIVLWLICFWMYRQKIFIKI